MPINQPVAHAIDQHARQHLQLSNMLAEGKGVKKKDAAKAKALRQKACAAGLNDAC